MELSLLCGSNVMLIISSEENRNPSVYCSNGGNMSVIKKSFNSVVSNNIKNIFTNSDVLNFLNFSIIELVLKKLKPRLRA